MLVLKRCLMRQLCRHPEVSLLCLLAGMLYIYTIFSSSENPESFVLHPRFNKDPEMDKPITSLSELAPDKFKEPRPVSPNTSESKVSEENTDDVIPTEVTTANPTGSHMAQSQNDDVLATEVTTAEPMRSHAAQSQSDDVKPAEEKAAEPIRSHAMQSQSDDVKPAEEKAVEPIRSHAAHSQNDDVKPAEEKTAEPIRSHTAQSQGDDVKPAEEKTAEPIRSHAAQSQSDDIKPAEEKAAEPIRSYAVQRQSDDVKPAEEKAAAPIRSHAVLSQSDDVKPAEEKAAEPIRSHTAQSQSDDVKPAEEKTAEPIRSHAAQSQSDDLKPAEEKAAEPIRSYAVQRQSDDVKPAEEKAAEPIRSYAGQRQSDDVKPAEEKTAEPIKSHAAHSQNDDVKPAEEKTAEPIGSYAAQDQNEDVKPSKVTIAEPIRSRVAQSQNDDVEATEVTVAKTSLQTSLQREEVSYTQEKQMEMPGGNMKCEANESCHDFPVESPEQAKIICNRYGPRCKGFVYSLRSGKFTPKGELTDKVVFSTENDLYVKSDFAQSNKTLQHGSCALPLDQFQSFSDGCYLPELDPNDKSIIQLISQPNLIQCPGFQLTRYEGGVLELTEEINRVDNISAISYQPILRPDHKDWGFVLGNVVSLQVHGRKFQLGSEFVRVQLSTADGKKHVEYHAQVVPRPLEHAISKVDLPLSVVIIGFDSLSAAHFQRALPEAYKFMSEELNSLFLKGYSIVGDGTTPALTALMTGKFESELPEARRQLPGTAPLDRWPHIFKDFKEKGYATLFSEDCPAYGAFNYRLHGFTEPPTDHFSRFFWEAAHMTSERCIHSKKQHSIHFDYTRSFLKAYRERPKFGLFFLTDISHNNLKSIYHCADDFSALLREFSEGNLLNDTLLVVMSDHGFRYGDTRATFQGKLEERLPIMSLTFPRWFLQQYPGLIHNLKENSDIVTSPFDLYATFKHILSYPQAPANLTRGESLLTAIDRSRDCDRAGVAAHYCPCIQWKEIETSVVHVQRAAQAVVDHVNNLTASDPFSLSRCSRLEVNKVLSAYQKLPNIKIAQFLGSYDVHGRKPMFSRGDVTVSECLYQIQIQTVPGNGLYEASVSALDGEYRVTGEISRINLYGEQPRCILDKIPDLRKFCLCKDYDGQ